MNKPLILAYLFTLMLFLGSCDQNALLDEYHNIYGGKWNTADEQEFVFEIKDNSVKYDIYFNFRILTAYEYYNLFINFVLASSDNKVILSQLHEMKMMDEKTSEPLGNGAGEEFGYKFRAIQNYSFAKPGKYTIKLQQYMRRNPLPNILAVGVRVSPSR